MSQMPPPPPTSTPQGAGPEGGSLKLVAVAVILAVVAVVLVNLYVIAAREQLREDEINIYMLRAPVETGDALDGKDVETVQMPKSLKTSFQSAGFIVGDADEPGVEDYLGKRFVRDAPRSGLLELRHFIRATGITAEVDVSPGKRLVAVPVDRATLPASLRPGTMIDLEAEFRGRGVLPVMERVRVIAVGGTRIQDVAQGEDAPGRASSKIDIEVAPEEATHLAQIEKRTVGSFRVHVRPTGETALPKIGREGINPEVLRLIGAAS